MIMLLMIMIGNKHADAAQGDVAVAVVVERSPRASSSGNPTAFSGHPSKN